jgi:hypothetical protein
VWHVEAALGCVRCYPDEGNVHADDSQHLPDIPERELSLDVLTMEQLGTQRLESLGALGGFGRQDLGSIGNLESLGKFDAQLFNVKSASMVLTW